MNASLLLPVGFILFLFVGYFMLNGFVATEERYVLRTSNKSLYEHSFLAEPGTDIFINNQSVLPSVDGTVRHVFTAPLGYSQHRIITKNNFGGKLLII